MADNREKAEEFLTRFRELAASAQGELQKLDQEASEARLLMKQLSTEVDRFGQRLSQLKGRVREVELNLNNYDRGDIRDLFDTLLETQTRQLTMQGQLDELRTKEQGIARFQQHLNRLVDIAIYAPESVIVEAAPRPALADLGVGTGRQAALAGHASNGGSERPGAVHRIIQAQEDERRMVSRQIHDGPAQSMANLILRAEICERLLSVDTNRARTELAGLKSMVTNTLQETRRFIFDLRPMALDDLGLMPTLRKYVQTVQERSGINVSLTFHGREERLPNYTEVALFRIVQEGVANAIQHASPNVVRVHFEVGAGVWHVEVQDDGTGFDTKTALANARERKTVGLASMIERAEAIGADLQVRSEPGRGTTITLDIPVEGAA